MIRAYKLVFRLDYDLSFDYLDSPGTLLKILTGKEKYWDEFAEGKSFRNLVAKKTVENTYGCNLALNPDNISGVFETLSGASWDGPDLRSYLAECGRVASAMMQECKIELLKRAGLRLYVLVDENPSPAAARSVPKALLADGFYKAFENTFGDIADSGVIIEGVLPSNLQFRMVVGPSASNDLVKTLKDTGLKVEDKKIEHWLTADIDIYETSLNFKGILLDKWARTKWNAADELVQFVAERCRATT